MATRAKALRMFSKNVLNLDVVGMSETAVLKDLLKKKYDIDADGNSFVSVLMNAAESGYSGVDLNGYTPSCVHVEVMDPDEDPDDYWARVYFEKDGAEPFWSDWARVGEPGQITADGNIAYIKDGAKSPEKNIYGIMGTNSETEGYIKFVDPRDMETVIATYTTGVC